MSQVNTISETSTANRIAHYFSKAAADYTRHHAIQQTVGGQLLERLQPVAGRLLDIGCGPASFYPQLSALAAQYYGVDVAAGMLEQARRQTPVTVPLLQGSAERLPFAADQFDACFANLSLQWCARLESAIAEMQRVLKANGQALFNLPVAGTFAELKRSWEAVDQHPHTQSFKTVDDVADCLARAGVNDYDVELATHTQYFVDTRALLQSIKGVGASFVERSQQPGLMTPRRFANFSKHYERFRTDQGLPLTWVITFIKFNKQINN